MNKNKCFLSFLYHIKSIFLERIFFIFYFLRKKKNWINFGFFLPKIHNESFNFTFYKNLISLQMSIPEGFIFDYIRSRIGRTYFKLFFKFLFGITHFSSYFLSFFRSLKKLIKIRLRNRINTRTKSYFFLRFFKLKQYRVELKELQNTFNYFICKKLSKTLEIRSAPFV